MPDVSDPLPTSSNKIIEAELRKRAAKVEQSVQANFLTYVGPIVDGAATALKGALESIENKKRRLVVNLETNGGYIESAERIANIIRHHYNVVDFVVTTFAMSAGTVLVMSGDNIYMDYAGTLGPIDPQVSPPGRGDILVPALGYLEQYQRLIEKSWDSDLTPAELAYLIQNFDPAELYAYEQERQLSITLLEEWLVKYKFKNWKTTRTKGVNVTETMKKDRAAKVAHKLNDTEHWHSHSRGISMQVARSYLNLEINDLDDFPAIRDTLASHNKLLRDYSARLGHDYVIIDWVGGYYGQ